MNTETSDHHRRLSVAEYGAALAKTGPRTLPGSGASVWVSYEIGTMQRMPTFYSTAPGPGEVQRIFWNGRAGLITYIVDADEQHPPNTWLYTCCDPTYSLEKLSKAARRDARRAQRNLQLGWIELPLLLSQGFSAYQETRTRVGLSDGTLEQFKKRFESFSRNPFHHFVGAWKGDALLAFMSLIVVGDWVEIQGSFSTQAQRDLCPNDGLANFVLQHYLVENKFKVVSYGLSSIQEDADKPGLHAFKQKIGFEATPVHRAFMLHPLFRPFANRLVLRGFQTALKVYPEAPWLRKASGILTTLLRKRTAEDGNTIFQLN